MHMKKRAGSFTYIGLKIWENNIKLQPIQSLFKILKNIGNFTVLKHSDAKKTHFT